MREKDEKDFCYRQSFANQANLDLNIAVHEGIEKGVEGGDGVRGNQTRNPPTADEHE